MRTQHATLVQVILAIVLMATAGCTPAIRLFILHQVQWLVVGLCLIGILYIQTLKNIYSGEKRLKYKLKQQAQLIDTLLRTNAINARLIKDIAVPELFEHYSDDLIYRLHTSGLTIAELMSVGIDKKIIAHYELFYFVEKAKEQQEIIAGHKKIHIESINAPMVKEMTSETDNGKYLRPVSA